MKWGSINATAYCVEPSKKGPGNGTYTIQKLADGKTLAKVCYYGTKASDEKHPDFPAGKRFIITHLAAAYANGSSDWASGTNATDNKFLWKQTSNNILHVCICWSLQNDFHKYASSDDNPMIIVLKPGTSREQVEHFSADLEKRNGVKVNAWYGDFALLFLAFQQEKKQNQYLPF